MDVLLKFEKDLLKHAQSATELRGRTDFGKLSAQLARNGIRVMTDYGMSVVEAKA